MATAEKSSKTKKSATKKASKPKKVATFTTSDIAEELGIESKTLRVFLRSQDMGVGRGKRYKFTEAEVAEIVDAYQSDEVEDDSDDETDDDE